MTGSVTGRNRDWLEQRDGYSGAFIGSRRGVRGGNQAVGRGGLRKAPSHTYKLRLTLLSGLGARVGNEWGHLTGLIYVQFGNRKNGVRVPRRTSGESQARLG